MRRFSCVTAPVIALLLLAGCSGPGAESGSSSSGGGSVGSGAAAPADPGAPEDAQRQVVTSATASLVVKDPAAGAQRVSVLVEKAGGRVDERTEQAASSEDDGAVADLVVRVPADALTGLLADLEDLGDVESVSVSRSDVTVDAVDLDARISALQTSVTRLQGLMDDAATTEALLAAESALSERQEKLESLQSQRSLLADQVELSTLSVHLRPVGVAPPGGPDGFVDGLVTGWKTLVSFAGAAAIALGLLLPWLAVAAVVAAVVLATIRVVRRRSAVVAPAPPAAPAPPQG